MVSSAARIVVGRDVAEVDHHAEPVHLAHDLAAEGAEATDDRHVGRRVGPRRVVVVGERQVTHAEHVQHPEGAEGAADRVAALGPEQRRDPAGSPRPLDLVGGAREGQPVGIRRDHAVHAVDLLERGRDGGVALQRARHEDRPELPADAALLEAGEVGLRRRHRPRDVERLEVVAGLLPRRPRQVVVTVDQRVPGEQGAGPRQGAAGGLGGAVGGRAGMSVIEHRSI